MDVDIKLINIINQIAEIDRKVDKENIDSIRRNVDRVKSELLEMGLTYRFPVGERYDETRTDCEANIVGDETKNLIITKVIKPIIVQEEHGYQIILQKGNVIVESV